ncbi:PAS domain-containing sensor histidine kinase [Olleya sp. YS]|uniref:sensor histidine kinase n=1 Tax=Olleya sp. YS TaxID=3028318 RepID=UPI0024340CD4|nr:PAS domain-containing sensor histidine kinase [Olleya sp. YS]WGD34340.1 PAS domain-containing sensor histidine kinase [Olleya sp. YS]
MSELFDGFHFNPNAPHFENVKWQLALEISKVGIWDYSATNNQVFFSKPSKAIIGFEDDADFGKNPNDWNDRVHPEDRDKYFQDFKDHLNGLNPIYENKHRVQHKNGSYRWILDRGQIIEKDTSGEATRIIGTHVDITEYAENEQKVQQTLDLVVRQNNKLQNFAHIVTHNLKQHAGNFESLLGFYKDAESINDKEEVIDYLNTLSDSLTKTINSLKEIVSVQYNKNTEISKLYLAKELNSIIQSLNFVITKNNATINNNIDPKYYIYYNHSYFESIFQNLLSNAIKYKHPNRDPIINVNLEQANNELIITVEDNGIGIDLEKYGNSIFELYKTFHNNPEAEGVGLYLVKSQIEAFNGHIDIDSKVNKGTTFIITIPNKKIQQ